MTYDKLKKVFANNITNCIEPKAKNHIEKQARDTIKWLLDI